MNGDKRQVRRAFAAAASRYDDLAGLQRQVGERLLSRLPQVLSRGRLVDLGCGTGWCARQLQCRYPDFSLVLVDLAEPMLHQARRRLGKAVYLCADAEHLPLASESVALLVSNLALQWCHRPERAIAEMIRVLRPGGWLLVSTFATGTLEELRQAWRQVDDYSHVNTFVDAEFLAKVLRDSAVRRHRVQFETLRCRYPSLLQLFRELKGIGAHNVTHQRPRHLLGRRRLQAVERHYPRDGGGGIVATFVPAYLIAVK